MPKKLIEIESSVKGDKEIIQTLKKFTLEMKNKAIAQSMRPSAKKIEQIAKSLVPVRTGETRDAIITRKLSKSKTRKQFGEYFIVYQVGVQKRRGHIANWLEYGTKKMSPRPFLRPAMNQGFIFILDDIKNNLRRKIPLIIRRSKKGNSR